MNFQKIFYLVVGFFIALTISSNAVGPAYSAYDQASCQASGGTWRLFTDANCHDRCFLLTTPPPINCLQAATFGCDCGPSSCWDDGSSQCVSNPSPPDLIVSSLTVTNCTLGSWTDPVTGLGYAFTEVSYDATFRDQGGQYASDFYNGAEMYVGGSLVTQATGGGPYSLGGGQSQSVSSSITKWYQWYNNGTIDYLVDPGGDPWNASPNGDVSESNESNNRHGQVAFNCGSTPTTGPATPTPTVPPTSWYFPSQVIDVDDIGAGTGATGIDNVVLQLYGSNASYVAGPPWTNPAVGPQVSDAWTLIRECTSSVTGGPVNEPGYCQLYSASYYPWFLIKVKNNQPFISVDSSACTFNHTTRPTNALDWCAVMDASNLRRGWYSAVSQGTYAGNVFYVSQVDPTNTPTPTVPTSTPTSTPPPQNPWFQAAGGNAYAGSDIYSNLPSGETFNTNITDVASDGISYSGSIDVGSGTAGKNTDSTSFPELLTYTELLNRFDTITTITGSSVIDQSRLSAGSGSLGDTEVYEYSGDATLQGWSDFSGNAVLFINGDVTVSENVTVDQGSFLGIIASGDISIDPTVDTVEGFYFTNSDFSTGSSSTQLLLNGTFVANNFVLERDLGAANNTTPAEVFSYRPDFSFTAPLELRRPYRHFQEVAP